MHPDDQIIHDRFKAELDAAFRRQVAGLLLGGAVAVGLVWGATAVGALPADAIWVGGVAGVGGPLVGAWLLGRGAAHGDRSTE